jgi:hypothetical protein
MDPATWNVLHDGSLTAVKGRIPGDVILSVEIAYLCRYLPTKASILNVTLDQCDQFEYRPYEAPPVLALSVIVETDLELLSAELNEGSMCIACSDGGYGGTLHLRYNSAYVATKEGHVLTLAELDSALDQYWTEWQAKNA